MCPNAHSRWDLSNILNFYWEEMGGNLVHFRSKQQQEFVIYTRLVLMKKKKIQDEGEKGEQG